MARSCNLFVLHAKGAGLAKVINHALPRAMHRLNALQLENYYLSDGLGNYDTVTSYHESLGRDAADVYFERGPTIPSNGERIKRQTIRNRRLLYLRQAA